MSIDILTCIIYTLYLGHEQVVKEQFLIDLCFLFLPGCLIKKNVDAEHIKLVWPYTKSPFKALVVINVITIKTLKPSKYCKLFKETKQMLNVKLLKFSRPEIIV